MALFFPSFVVRVVIYFEFITSRAPPPRDRCAPTNGRHRIRLCDKSYNPDRPSPTPSCNTRNGTAQKRPVDVRPLAMPRYIFHLSLLISFLVMLLVGRVPFFMFPLSVSFRSLFSLYILPTRRVLPTSLEINLNFPSCFLVPLFHDISGAAQRRYRWEQPFPSIFQPPPSSILTFVPLLHLSHSFPPPRVVLLFFQPLGGIHFASSLPWSHL